MNIGNKRAMVLYIAHLTIKAQNNSRLMILITIDKRIDERHYRNLCQLKFKSASGNEHAIEISYIKLTTKCRSLDQDASCQISNLLAM
jgi:hypothetical protein